jgi:hypothetical protein
MSETPAVSLHRSTQRQSPLVRSLAIIATATVIGPPVGSIVVLLLMRVTIGVVREGTVLAEILQFESAFKEFILMGYFVGLLPALCFGVLFSISAFAFGRNSLLAAIAVSLLASLASPVMMGHIYKYGVPIAWAAELKPALLFGVAPAVVAAIVCWCITRRFHRSS